MEDFVRNSKNPFNLTFSFQNLLSVLIFIVAPFIQLRSRMHLKLWVNDIKTKFPFRLFMKKLVVNISSISKNWNHIFKVLIGFRKSFSITQDKALHIEFLIIIYLTKPFSITEDLFLIKFMITVPKATWQTHLVKLIISWSLTKFLTS